MGIFGGWRAIFKPAAPCFSLSSVSEEEPFSICWLLILFPSCLSLILLIAKAETRAPSFRRWFGIENNLSYSMASLFTATRQSGPEFSLPYSFLVIQFRVFFNKISIFFPYYYCHFYSFNKEFFGVFFVFSGPHPQHVKVPRLWVESKRQLQT